MCENRGAIGSGPRGNAPSAVAVRGARRPWCLVGAVLVLVIGGGCPGPSDGAGADEHATVEAPAPALGSDEEVAEPAAGSGGPEATGGSGDAAAATLWFGIYCSAPEPGTRHFSVYVDGTLVQEVDGSCSKRVQPGIEPPNGGQFRVVVPTGVRVVRFQDDTSDYFTEHDVAVPGNHWVFVHHRVLDGETGHLTSMIDRFERPRFAY